MMGKGEFAVFVAPRLRGLLNNRTIGGRKKRQPPQRGAKIAQLGAEKRQNRMIEVRLKKKNGAERDRTDDL